MADFLGDYSDSEQDVESRVDDDASSVSSEESTDSGCRKWLKVEGQTDGIEEADETGKWRSKKEKALDQLVGLSDRVDFTDEPEAYHKLLSDAFEFLEKQFYPKYHFVPSQLIESFRTVESAWAEATATPIGDDDDDSTKEEREARAQRRKDARHWTQVKKVLTAALEFFKDKKTDLDVEEEVEPEDSEEDDDDPDTLTEDQLAAVLIEQFSNSKVKTRNARRWVARARTLNRPYLSLLANVKLCSSYLDCAPQTGITMKNWENAKDALLDALSIAESNANIAVSESGAMKCTERHVTVLGGWLFKAKDLAKAVVTMFAFQSEFTLNLQLARLECESAVLLARCLQYYRGKKQKAGMASAALALLDLIHVRTPDAHLNFNYVVAPIDVLKKPVHEAVEELYAIINENSSQSEDKISAALARIYNLCLQREDRFIEARETLLRESITPETVKTLDVSIKVQYNRTIAQLAFAAFRHGHFDASHNLLSDLCNKNWNVIRELLGQRDLIKPRNGRVDSKKKTSDLLNERERLVPSHHTIPVSLLEQGYLVLSTLQDLLHETKNPEDRLGRSKQFHNLCKRIENAPFSGPPGSDDDFIYAAYVALQAGDVEGAIAHVRRLSGWALLPPGSFTLDMLVYKMRVDGLKVFLISLGQHYKSLTVEDLVSRFGLPADVVRATFSRLLLENALLGYWNDDDKYVVIERGPQTKLHFQARECADRLTEFIAINDNGGRPDRRAGGRGRGRGGRGGMRGRSSY